MELKGTLHNLTTILIISSWLLLLSHNSISVHATERDIACLKSIRDSLEDPHGHLTSTWNFNNETQFGFVCSFQGIECWNKDENRVLGIHLSNLGLRGTFPIGIRHCTGLMSLDLSKNDLYGHIPSEISNILPFTIKLVLSSNRFSGRIPASVGNLRFLNTLLLDHNRLSGEIPSRIGQLHVIRRFNVADNMLVGRVPVFVNVRFSAESYANNPGLCGYPLNVSCSSHKY